MLHLFDIFDILKKTAPVHDECLQKRVLTEMTDAISWQNYNISSVTSHWISSASWIAGDWRLTGVYLMPQTDWGHKPTIMSFGKKKSLFCSALIPSGSGRLAASSQTPSSQIHASQLPSPIHSACNWSLLSAVHSCLYRLRIAAKQQSYMYQSCSGIDEQF